ncbi:MAG: type III pantothenate kinase [Bacteroidetes bacterium]|nr:type III pantothenate kinase [Bacteroidota bacterium]
MNLVIDQGNTAVKLGLFDQNQLVQKAIFLNDELGFAQLWLQSKVLEPVHVMVCSVVAHEFELSAVPALSFFRLDSSLALPIKNKYRTPETLGKDRLSNAVGAWKQNPSKNSLVVDLGTCIKYDLVSAEGSYLGGAISPGLEMRFKALHEFTDKLPLLETSTPADDYGTDTTSSIAAGVKQGMIHEINGFIERYSLQLDDLTIFMTGGDLKYFDKAFKNRIFALPDLTLIGLNEILQHNIQQK